MSDPTPVRRKALVTGGATGIGRSAVLALARSSGDDYPGRSDEPYRRALLAVQSRVAATYAALTGQAPPRNPAPGAVAYASPQELRADLAALARSLVEHGGAWTYVGQTLLYATAYASLLLVIASLIFRRRDFL